MQTSNEKIITIDGKEIGFRASSALAYLYKEAFGTEYMTDLLMVIENIPKGFDGMTFLMYRLIWCLAKCYGSHYGIPVPPIHEWLDSFTWGSFQVKDIFDMLLDIVQQDIKVDRKNE